MGFSGWAPEVVNGRVAQLAFVAGVGAELVTGETLPHQFHDHIFSLVFASTLIALASFMPVGLMDTIHLAGYKPSHHVITVRRQNISI